MIFSNEANNIRYISGGYFVSKGLWTHPKRRIDDCEIMVVIKGTVNLFYQDKTCAIHKDEMFLICPGVLHYGIGEAEDISFYWLHFGSKRSSFEEVDTVVSINNKISQTGYGFSGIMIPDHFLLDSNKITILTRQLLHYTEEQYYTARIHDIIMELILIEITQQYINLYKGSNQKMQSVCDWIRANIYLGIGLMDVAGQFGYNKEYLARTFKSETGMTVKQYIIKMQMESAKKSLLETNETIEQIAVRVGMQDVKVFMKLFKREENMTPTQFRKTFHKIHYNSK